MNKIDGSEILANCAIERVGYTMQHCAHLFQFGIATLKFDEIARNVTQVESDSTQSAILRAMLHK